MIQYSADTAHLESALVGAIIRHRGALIYDGHTVSAFDAEGNLVAVTHSERVAQAARITANRLLIQRRRS